MSLMRYAIVRGLGVNKEKVAAYLPKGYRVLWEGTCTWHPNYLGVWTEYPNLDRECVVIGGRDGGGFTLDRYVIPRLGSGMMRCDECGLDHPVMKNIPDEA